MSIETKSAEFVALESKFKKSAALLGGTDSMRKAAEAYLPKMGVEDDEGYKTRLKKSVLHAVYSETVRQMVGRVFFSPVDTSESKINEDYLVDFDDGGTSIGEFLQKPFKDGLAFGRGYVVITAPNAENVKTREQEKLAGIRPYAVYVDPRNVLGVQREKGRITGFRYANKFISVDENYEETEVEQIIEHTPGLVKVHTVTESGTTTVESEIKANNKQLTEVPVAELKLSDSLPLDNLADLNVKHWQSSSDQDNILSYARVPMLWLSGIAPGDDFKVGGLVTTLPDKDAKMGWCEHTGASIEAGRQSILDLEAQCQAEGAKLLTRTKLALTDSQAKDEAMKDISTLRHYTNLLEDFTNRLLYFYSLYSGSESGVVKIGRDIDIDKDTTAITAMLTDANRDGVISDKTRFEELQKAGVIGDHLTWEDEKTRILNENPAI